MTPSRPPTVVYIGGAGRSGSTLLDNLLGSSPGWFSAGELRLLWRARQLWTHRCGCGQPLRECEFWTSVLREVGEVDLEWATAMDERLLRSRRAWRLVTRTPVTRVAGGDAFVDVVDRLVRSISVVSGDSVIVDSSKSPMGIAVLCAAGVNVVAVQLVRDPRAIAWSWRRSSATTDAMTPFTSRTVPGAAVEWLGNNLAMEACVRRSRVAHVCIRYEDLIDHPARALAAIGVLAGADANVSVDASMATLAGNHTVAGNPSRFRIGAIELRRDDEWRTRLSMADRAVATAITLPLLTRYGYWPGHN